MLADVPSALMHLRMHAAETERRAIADGRVLLSPPSAKSAPPPLAGNHVEPLSRAEARRCFTEVRRSSGDGGEGEKDLSAVWVGFFPKPEPRTPNP